MKAVLVTGATTPLGLKLIRRLLDDDDVEHVLAVGIEPVAPSLPHGWERLTYVQGDLTRARRIRALLFGPVRDLGVDAIVHTAQHRSASGTGRRVHLLNVESTRLMLRLCEHHPTIESFVLRSYARVYLVRPEQPYVVREDAKLDMRSGAPQWVRDRVEADLTTCGHMGLTGLRIMVLRMAEVFGPDCGSQLYDFLQSKLCFRSLGYDPMLNLLSVDDSARALHLALKSDQAGVVNIPGADTLPLSVAVRKWGNVDLAVPASLIGPLYRARAMTRGGDFRFDMNMARFHFSGIPDGGRAREVLGYEPDVHVEWPVPEAARPLFRATT